MSVSEIMYNFKEFRNVNIDALVWNMVECDKI